MSFERPRCRWDTDIKKDNVMVWAGFIWPWIFWSLICGAIIFMRTKTLQVEGTILMFTEITFQVLFSTDCTKML